ncbi:MAG TPA: hypothetical protein VIF62_15155 [Labilithrix sp.]
MRAVVVAFAVAGCSPSPPAVSAIEVPVAADAAPPAARTTDPGDIPIVGTTPSSSSGAMERALAEWSSATRCSSFDYHPDGGIQSFWCHRPQSVEVAAIRALSGLPHIFASGPHSGDDLVLDAPNDFGHYDPAFVRWLVDHAGPAPRQSAARAATQPAYDAHMKPLAAIFWKVLQKTQRDAACFAREKDAYADLVAKKKLPKRYYERWFWFMNPYFCDRGLKAGDAFYFDNAVDAGVDGNVTKTVVGFWIRRTLDGTASTFAEGLTRLVQSYDAPLYDAPFGLPDAASITRAIDAGMRAAASCKDPKAHAASTQLDVVVQPDGHLRAAIAYVSVSTAQERCLASAFATATLPPYRGGELHFKRIVPLR